MKRITSFIIVTILIKWKPRNIIYEPFSHEGDENYTREADLNGDGTINVIDLMLVAMHWTAQDSMA